MEAGATANLRCQAEASGPVSSHPAGAERGPRGKGTLVPGAAAWGSVALLLLVLNFLFCLLPVRF